MNVTNDFDADYFARLAAAREHWWVRGMQLAGSAVLGATTRDAPLLDVGCGTGSNLGWAAGLTSSRPLHAIDLFPAAAAVAAQALPDEPVATSVASATSLPYRDSQLGLVLSLDVLQHLTTDGADAALREIHRVLRPGGQTLVRTNSNFGRRRVAQRQDWRLYDPSSLRAAAETAGLHVVRVTSVNMLQALWASLPRPTRIARHHDHDHDQTAAQTGHCGLGIPRPAGPVRNLVLYKLLAAEARWLKRPGRSFPFGHSLLLVAERPLDAQT